MMENEVILSDNDRRDVYEEATEEAARLLRQEENNRSTSPGHKRSLSGSILSKLSFLRPAAESRDTAYDKTKLNGILERTYHGGSQAALMAKAAPANRTRSRKGSLRKTAILGTGRLKQEGRDKRVSSLEIGRLGRVGTIKIISSANAHSPLGGDSTDELLTPRPSDEGPVLPRDDITANGLNLQNDNTSEEVLTMGLVRKPTLGDMSTTDEDEALSYPHANGAIMPVLKKPVGESFFPLESSGLLRRRSSKKPKAALIAIPTEVVITAPEEWDYTETEWWGWVILLMTWIVFVVGMGSCFEVWSWAWDVGETPYAPPELEDDPTLPIVGYYPALIILTGVMAWVWVVVAWVGMKYFKHAKISGDDV